MRFDWPSDGDFGQETRAAKTLALAPDGRHVGEIVDAKAKKIAFMKSDANRDGASLVIVVAIGSEYEVVESIIPAHYQGKIEALARAAGVEVPRSGEDWDEKSVIGKTVSIDTLQAVSNKGTQYVQIKRWHPSPSQPIKADRKPPARSQTAKAHKEFSKSSDDIPF